MVFDFSDECGCPWYESRGAKPCTCASDCRHCWLHLYTPKTPRQLAGISDDDLGRVWQASTVEQRQELFVAVATELHLAAASVFEAINRGGVKKAEEIWPGITEWVVGMVPVLETICDTLLGIIDERCADCLDLRGLGPCQACRNKDRLAAGLNPYLAAEPHRGEKYGLSASDLQRMLNKAEGRCEICRDPLTAYNVDHNHDTGEVRGILCRACNTALGVFRDDPTILRSAVRYLTDRGDYGHLRAVQ